MGLAVELASQFHTVILSGVPRMSAAMSSEARRFTWLIDVFYDHKVKLLISAEVPAEELYTEGQMAIDVFYLTSSGAKLGSEKQAELKADLLQELQEA